MEKRVIPEEAPEIDVLRKELDEIVTLYSDRMIEMSDWMYHNPESGYEEFKASMMLTKELEKLGFEVEHGVPGLDPDFDRLKFVGGLRPDYDGPIGMPTAFKAKYKGKTETPVIGYLIETDALRGNPPFHGCQHNMQGPAGIGGAFALATVMEKHKIPGSVWVVHSPAEEVGPSAKAYQAKAGYYNGIDFFFRSHGTPNPFKTERSPAGFSERHVRQIKYTFHGKSSHAQRAWQGVSALDSVMLLFHGMEMLREHSEPQFRFHGIVTDGGVAPNIVPELASAAIWIRHLSDNTAVGSVSPMKAGEIIDAKVEQLNNIARGAALATGTKVDIDLYGSIVPGISVGVLNDLEFQYAVDYGGIKINERKIPRCYEDSGHASIAVRGTRVVMAFEGISPVPGHSHENADITITPEGHRALILTAKVLGSSGLRLVMDPEMREEAKKEHAIWKKKYYE